MFIDPIFKGIGNFPVMVFTVATIKVIHPRKIVWFKSIREFIEERIKREKTTKFYESFKAVILDNIQELEVEFEIVNLEQKYKNIIDSMY